MNTVSSEVEICGKTRCLLGEAPVWCPDSQSLLWVDILQQQLLRFWPEQNGRTESHPLPAVTGSVLLTDQPEIFLVVSQCGIQIYDYLTRNFTLLHPWPQEGTRPNEAAIAPDGALWFSSMDPGAARPLGCWYRLSPETNTLQRLITDQWVPNTLAWTAQGVWFADSLRHVIYRGTFNGDTLEIAKRYPVYGLPDGSALTHDGQLFNARWGDSCLVRYQIRDDELLELQHIALPATQPSSCTFGGATLSDLYITSAIHGLATPAGADGALLKISTPLTGTPAGRFHLKNHEIKRL